MQEKKTMKKKLENEGFDVQSEADEFEEESQNGEILEENTKLRKVAKKNKEPILR
jgi:hypothetical protein